MAKLTIYRTYRFLDKDPLIDAMRTVVRDELTKDGQLIPGYVKARGTKLDYEQEIAKQADWLLKQGRKKQPRKKKNGANK